MRTIEYLAKLYPEKTGKELFEIQEQDKIEDKEKFERINQKKLSVIEDINSNGGYFKGRFGLSQCFYYSFFNLRLSGEIIICDVNCITCFFENGSTHIEQRIEEYREFENYGTSVYTRVTKEDFDKVLSYLRNSEILFW